MRIGRTLPPSAAPLSWRDYLHGLSGQAQSTRMLDRITQDIREQFGVRSCFLVSSGTAALTLILSAAHAIDKKQRPEVIIPAFSCSSLPSAIIGAGLKVRLADCDPTTLDFDLDTLTRALMSPNVLAVVTPHLFGLPANMAEVKARTATEGVLLVEDAAQALGTWVDGKALGTLGDVGFFSLGRGKALSAYEGGIIITNDERLERALSILYERLPAYSTKGIVRLMTLSLAYGLLLHPYLFWFPKSLPFIKFGVTPFAPYVPVLRMSGFQSGVFRNWKAKLSAFQARRTSQVARWSKELVSSNVRTYGTQREPLPLVRYPVLLRDRATKERALREGEDHGLGVSVTYEALSVSTDYAWTGPGHFPGAQRCADGLIGLPTNQFVTESDRRSIVELLRS